MAFSGDVPFIPFPIEAPHEGACAGTLRAFPCACGALEDATFLFLRDTPLPEETSPSDAEEVVACIQTDLILLSRVAPLENLLRLWRFEPNFFLEALLVVVRTLDAVPGLPVRLVKLLFSLGWMTGSFSTLFRASDATLIVPWLRKMDVPCVQEASEDGNVSLEGLPLFIGDLPVASFIELLFVGACRVHAYLYLYRDGQSDVVLR